MKITCIEHPYLGQFSKSFILETQDGEYLIDTGIQSGISYIESIAKNIKGVLCTHEHWDHTGGNAHFREQGAAIYAHSDAVDIMEDIEYQYKLLYGQFEESCYIPPARKETYYKEAGRPVKTDVILEEGQELQLGEVKLQIFSIPGHSNGSVAIYLPESGNIFTGDVVSGSGFFKVLPQINDVARYRETLEKLKKIDVEAEYGAHSAKVHDRREYQQCLQDGLDCTERIFTWTKQYLDSHPKEIKLGRLAEYICEKEGGKASGSGAYITSAAYLQTYAEQYETAAVCCQKYIL